MNIKSGHILLSTAYFPPLSYFAQLARFPVIQIEQMETFPKQTFRNRCEIMTEAGMANLIVPVSRPNGNHTITRDIEISYKEPWQQYHWKTLQAAYRSSPFFNYYDELIYPFFTTRERSLLYHNLNILKRLCSIIGFDINVELTTDFRIQYDAIQDLRYRITPKKEDIITEFPAYPQVFGHKFGFMGGLSILDLLFNTGPETFAYLEEINRAYNSTDISNTPKDLNLKP